jgi:hypothetical protein
MGSDTPGTVYVKLVIVAALTLEEFAVTSKHVVPTLQPDEYATVPTTVGAASVPTASAVVLSNVSCVDKFWRPETARIWAGLKTVL